MQKRKIAYVDYGLTIVLVKLYHINYKCTAVSKRAGGYILCGPNRDTSKHVMGDFEDASTFLTPKLSCAQYTVVEGRGERDLLIPIPPTIPCLQLSPYSHTSQDLLPPTLLLSPVS